MISASVVETLKKAHPGAHVYSLASTGEVVIERGGRKRGRANITVLSQAEALQQARQLAGSGGLSISTRAREMEARVAGSLIQFFEMQQVVWLHLEECAVEAAPGPIEDITNSNSDPEEYYSIVGTDLGTSDVAQEEDVVNAKDVTRLKLAAADLIRARVIEFKHRGRTYVRAVRKADRAAFAAIKSDIEGEFRLVAPEQMQAIVVTLKVRPGFVYV